MEQAMTRGEWRNLRVGLLFISPWIVGFLALFVYPLVCSAYFSLCDYSVLTPAVFVGAANYRDLVADATFWKSLYNTFYFAAFAIPLSFVISFLLALLLNFDVPGRGIFRTLFFLPSLMPMVCLAVLWQWMLNGDVGLVNAALRPLLNGFNWIFGAHLSAPNWMVDARFAKWGLIFASLWGVGQAVVIYLAGLQDVPRYLYEAADIDGAGFWLKTLHISLPILSPVIYFNCVMALIGSLQVFAVPYVMTGGTDGPERSLLFIATYLYENAFDYWNMGYASAIGMVMFGLILLITYLATKLSERHVFYAGK
jgi:multiple sugar transport system permease protein